MNFVVHKNVDKLKEMPEYPRLINLGFMEEICLGNKAFISEYIDKKR